MNTTIDSTMPSSNALTDLRTSIAVLGILIYVCGFIGNLLSFIFFAQKDVRQVSTGLSFLLLNIFSTIHLISLVLEFLNTIFHIQYSSSIFRCQFLLWLQNLTRAICALLASTISFDRFLRSEYPLQSRQWCTTTNTLKLFIGYAAFSTAFYAIFFHPSNTLDSTEQCSYGDEDAYRIFVLNVVPLVRFFLVCAIPTIVMLGCGGRMLYNIRQSRKRVAIAVTNTHEQKSSQTADHQLRSVLTADHMLVVMVIANVATYIITQLPFNIYTLYYGYGSSSDPLTYSLVRALLVIWGSLYFGIGFYLYCLTSKQFREQLKKKMKTFCLCFHIH